MMKKSLLAFTGIITMSLWIATYGQTIVYAEIVTHIDSIITTLPTGNGTGDYQQPNAESRQIWQQIIQLMLEGNYTEAHATAQLRDYQIVHVIDPDGITYHVLERDPASTSRHWGTYVFNDNAQRSKLIVQCPHPVYDRKTGNLGVRLFQQCSARAYFVAGTHRCNGASSSPCDGTTSACSDASESYRYSDMAHVVLGPFHVATEVLYNNDPEILIIQPHGFSKGSSDPDIIMSNGTRLTPANRDCLLDLRENLSIVDPTLTFKVAHKDLDWTTLIATTNVQGRLLNNSSSLCYANASSASGQFMHLEMAYSGLRDTEINWSKLIQATRMTFPLTQESDSNRCYLHFDGVNDYLMYDHSVSLKSFADRAIYTLEVSFRFNSWDDVSDYDRILDLKDQLSVYLKMDGSVIMAVYAGSNTYYYYSQTGTVKPGEWNHLAICRYAKSDSYRLKFFHNGIDVTADTTKTGIAIPSVSANPVLYVGRRANIDNGFQGDIDRIRLSAAALYSSDFDLSNFPILDTLYKETLIALEFEDPENVHYAENRGWTCTNAYLGSNLSGDSAEPQWMLHSDDEPGSDISGQFPVRFCLPLIYPNPFNKVAKIRFNGFTYKPVKIHIYNLAGQLVCSREIQPLSNGPQEIALDFSAQSSGLYFYRINDQTGIYDGKMIFLK